MFEDFKGAIFDLDGTLLDSMQVWQRVDLDFFEKMGLEMPEDYSQAIKILKFSDAAAYTKKRFNLSDTVEAIITQWHEMVVHEYANNIHLKPGAKEYLINLRQNGIKIALATGSGRELYEIALKRVGVYELFDAFSTLSEVTSSKGEAEIFLLTAHKLGLTPSDCVVFEDIFEAVCGAKAAGMRVIGVYDESSLQDRTRIELAANGYIMDFRELL